jgi:hypothetical protein
MFNQFIDYAHSQCSIFPAISASVRRSGSTSWFLRRFDAEHHSTNSASENNYAKDQMQLSVSQCLVIQGVDAESSSVLLIE